MEAIKVSEIRKTPLIREAATTHVGQFIDSSDPGGAEEVVINLSTQLLESGFQVTIFHFGNSWLAENAEKRGLAHVQLDRSFYESKVTLFLFVFQFRKILLSLGVHLLHSHLLGAVFAGAVTARISRIASCGTLHDTYSLGESAYSRRMLRSAIAMGSKLYVVAEQMKSIVAVKAGLSPSLFGVIYNGIELDCFATQSPTEVESKPVRLITVARLIPIKRIDLMLLAISQTSVRTEWELWIAGDGPERESLEVIATKQNIHENVRFLGFRSDIPELLAEADIFLQSSDSEGLSVSVIESMAAGLPAIVTDVGGNRELVDSGKTGLLFPPGETEALTSALNTLIDNPLLRSRLGDAARVSATERFSSDTMAKNYGLQYEALLR